MPSSGQAHEVGSSYAAEADELLSRPQERWPRYSRDADIAVQNKGVESLLRVLLTSPPNLSPLYEVVEGYGEEWKKVWKWTLPVNR